MILYIDKTEVPDLEDLSPSVLRYCIRKAEQARGRYKHLMDYYLGQHDIFLGKPGTNEVRVSANYAKYVVDVTLGYYLGEAVKYDANQRRDDGDKAVHDDEMETVTPDLSGSDVIDLSPLLDCYDSQRISQLDLELGRTMGIMGDCMEVCYASSDADPQPRSARISPDNGILVCDSTVEHNKLFGIVWEQRENTNGQKYYCRSTTMPDMTDEQLRKVSRAARDPATGKGITVPADMKYPEWYEKYVKGRPEAEAKEQAYRNKAADREQFRRYRAVLGENAPKTLEEFQRMKYTGGEKWAVLRQDIKTELGRREIVSALAKGPSSDDFGAVVRKNHHGLRAYSPAEMKAALARSGFDVKPLSRGNFKGVPFEQGGGYKTNYGGNGIFQYHPESRSHHGGAYWKVRDTKGGNRYDMEGNAI